MTGIPIVTGPPRRAGESDQLLAGVVEAGLEPLDLTEPSVGPDLGDPVPEIVRDLGQPRPLRWRHPHPAAARVTNNAAGNAVQRFITSVTYTGCRLGHGPN